LNQEPPANQNAPPSPQSSLSPGAGGSGNPGS
jgi:hypothetical protein